MDDEEDHTPQHVQGDEGIQLQQDTQREEETAHRTRIIREILETEQAFVHNLWLVNKVTFT